MPRGMRTNTPEGLPRYEIDKQQLRVLEDGMPTRDPNSSPSRDRLDYCTDYGRVGGQNPTPGRDDLRFRVLNDNLCSTLTSSLCICEEEEEENDAQSLRLGLTKVHPGGLARCGICGFEGIGVGIPSETKTRIYSAIKDL
ncbi:hypothetical protein KQX54_021390 [Cotesia glomerata]|uniref:Uncharacterized protein n=1 Tax=Cotesia glomerata TaxID=32391 RepID=A0AAV7J6Q5_COTGL|nr:hypothetical protein KQX54_021390 [Cotesia glomerata]